MKQPILLISLCFLLSALNSFSQHTKTNAQPVKINPNYIVKSPTDTLEPSSFSTGTPILYSFIDGGYCFGNSPLQDKAFAQKYLVPQSYLVHGAALWIKSKEIIGNADSLSVNFYRLEGPGTDTSGIVNNAPDSAFQTMKFSVSQIDTTGLTFIIFPDSFIVYVDYAVGIDISAMEDDTIGIVTTTDGDALQSQLSWEMWSDHTWHTVLEPTNWEMDLDFGIFVIADMSSANIDDSYYIDGIKLSQNQPNPASGCTFIQYEVAQNAEDVSLEIYDMSGRLISTINEGRKAAGLYSIKLDTELLKNGVYYYSLKAGKHRLTKKMILSR